LEVEVHSEVMENEKPLVLSLSGDCAGAQLDFPAQQFQGLAEVWAPFEEAK
jgi:hypothetical protein